MIQVHQFVLCFCILLCPTKCFEVDMFLRGGQGIPHTGGFAIAQRHAIPVLPFQVIIFFKYFISGQIMFERA